MFSNEVKRKQSEREFIAQCTEKFIKSGGTIRDLDASVRSMNAGFNNCKRRKPCK